MSATRVSAPNAPVMGTPRTHCSARTGAPVEPTFSGVLRYGYSVTATIRWLHRVGVTVPVTGRCCDFWNAFTAAVVLGPYVPAPVSSVWPMERSASCSAFTDAPAAPGLSVRVRYPSSDWPPLLGTCVSTGAFHAPDGAGAGVGVGWGVGVG